ncbi:MAG: hypothetical protein JSW39_14890 [Desulfobacterales bacterium]|nr:MAG: hypothetical protein JSW39_14890 [Desulfobacterales bacterium]
MEKYSIGQDLVQRRMAGSDLQNLRSIHKAMGRLPHGTVGDVHFSEISLDVDHFARKIVHWMSQKIPDPIEVDRVIAGFRLRGRLTEIYGQGCVHTRSARQKAKDLLKSWIYHLVLSDLPPQGWTPNTILICQDSAWRFPRVTNNEEILHSLLEIFRYGSTQPLQFFSESAIEYAQGRHRRAYPRARALDSARRKSQGSEFAWGESEDPYYRLCFKHSDPLDQNFEKLAMGILGPLLEHCEKIIM